MCFKIDWARLIVGSKFTFFAFFYFVFEGIFPSTSPRCRIYLEGQFNGGFFCVTGLGGLYLEGLNFGILRYLRTKYLKSVLIAIYVRTCLG